VQVTDQLGCTGIFSGTVLEPSQMTVVNSSTSPVSCNGYSDGAAWVQVEGGIPPFTYQWNSGGTSNPITGRSAGAHIVTVVDSHGCIIQHPLVITNPPALTLTAYVADTVCVNVPVPLTAIAGGGTGAAQITWAGIGTGASVTYSFPASQIVSVSVTDANNCPGPVLQLPVSVLDLQAADLNTYGDTVVCPGGYSYVGAMLGNYSGAYTMVWPQLANTGSGPFMVPITSNQTLNVIVTDQCSQSINSTVQLGVQIPPSITLPSMIAQGCTPLTVQIPDNLTSTPVTYAWQLGNGSTSSQQAPLVTYNAAGSYTISLTVTTPLGCTATALNTGQVIAYASPQVSLNADPWITDIDHATIEFTGQSNGNIIYSMWDFGDGSSSNAIDPSHTYSTLGSFPVTYQVQDANGCSSIAEGMVEITPVYDITVPNIFTPDLAGGGSGSYSPWDLSNDVFYPFVRYVDDYRMRIFNRWGELIFESNDLKRGWDGYYRDQLSPQDVYVYQLWVRFVDGMEKHQLGDITLMR
nr:PKD domain-containing protein [Bacteroidota bacterium]